MDDILASGELPKQYANVVDLAVGLGTVFGNALCIGYGWEWKGFGDSKESAVYGVVSSKRYFSHAPLLYLHRILTGNNMGLDGKNDNTILLLYNMLEDIDSKPEDKMYIPMA